MSSGRFDHTEPPRTSNEGGGLQGRREFGWFDHSLNVAIGEVDCLLTVGSGQEVRAGTQ